MSKIYIVLIKAHTGLGSVARKLKNFEYTHVALCLNNEFTDFYSFSRRHHYLPADCGYTVEKRDFYAFGDYKQFKTKIFELDVPEDNYVKIINFMDECKNDSEMMFNAISMMFMPVEIYKTHNCMTFTAKILEISGMISMSKAYYKMRLRDIDKALDSFVYSEGLLDRESSIEYEEYMRKYSIWTKIALTTRLFVRLIGRMFTK